MMASIQNARVICNTGNGHALKSIKAHVLQMSRSGGSWKGAGLKRRYSHRKQCH